MLLVISTMLTGDVCEKLNGLKKHVGAETGNPIERTPWCWLPSPEPMMLKKPKIPEEGVVRRTLNPAQKEMLAKKPTTQKGCAEKP